MADDLYKQLQGIATEQMRAFKQGNVQIARAVEGNLDPLKPYNPGAITVTKIDLAAVVSGVSAYQIDGKQIEANDLVVVCAAVTPAGAPLDVRDTDVVMIDGRAHDIKKIEKRPAAGTPISYAIFVAG